MHLKEIENQAILEIQSSKNKEELNLIKIKYLGRNGILGEEAKKIPKLLPEERRNFGILFNQVKKTIEKFLNEKEASLQEQKIKSALDLTKPGVKIFAGFEHPLAQAEEEIIKIFSALNFSVVEGPELEEEYYNFDALNIPQNHPAREMWDTFWIKKDKNQKKNLLLRTHTSPMQVRYMLSHYPPLRIIVPGRVFRYEAIDQSHSINFYQVEGLMVGKNVNLANFKFIIESFFKKFFRKKIEFRYRPSYFPFTEPSIEVDIKIENKWLEVMGAGMVSRHVFDAVHYNPDEVQGFAFGMGLDRLVMIKYNIPDIRLFYENDLRFLKQF